MPRHLRRCLARSVAPEVLVFCLDYLHGVVDGLAEVRALGKLQEVAEASLGREINDALRLVVDLSDLPAARRRLLDPGLGRGELLLGEAEEDEPKHWGGVLRWLQLRIRPELIRGIPEALFEVVSVTVHKLLPARAKTLIIDATRPALRRPASPSG